MTLSKEDLESLFPKIKNGSRNHIITDCPLCGKSDHFYINRFSQLWDCKKCGEDGNIFKLLSFLDKLFLLGDFKSIERAKIKSLSDYSSDEEDVSIETEIRKLPLGFKRIFSNDYLKSRKFVESNFRENVIGTTNLIPRLKDYVIFSIDDEFGCKGFIARYSKKNNNNKKILRYRNDKGVNFSKLLYGFNNINNSTRTLILVEGLIDKITLDNFLRLPDSDDIKCCATFGKKISRSQIAKILTTSISDVILIFDMDAIKEMKKFSLELNKYFNVKVGYTLAKDINESDDDEIINIFNNLKTPKQFNRNVIIPLK